MHVEVYISEVLASGCNEQYYSRLLYSASDIFHSTRFGCLDVYDLSMEFFLALYPLMGVIVLD